MKIRELLTDESKWTKGENRRNRAGLPIKEKAEATCWCLSGAMFDCYGANPIEYWTVNRKITSKIEYGTIARWNDAPERTFEDVKKLVEELDI